jgi:uncharacterized RDD family membrane protein YckC
MPFTAMIIRMQTDSYPKQRQAKPAHLTWRLLALIYDAVIAIALLMLTSALILYVNKGTPTQTGSLGSYLELWVFWLVLGIYAVCSWRCGGQTLGMRPWHLFVLNKQGKNASWQQLCVRYFIVSLSAGLALLWSLFHAERRGLHDLLSGTYFVRLQTSKLS